MYDQFLSNSLSSTLLKSKEMLLQIKNDLLLDFENSLTKFIEGLIEKNYSKYVNSLLNKIKLTIPSFGKTAEIIIFLNSKDFKYIQINKTLLEKFFKKDLEYKESKELFIGGFKLFENQSKVLYDHSFNNLISREAKVIEREFSSIYLDIDLESFQKDFENSIKKKKADIEEYLKKYDEI